MEADSSFWLFFKATKKWVECTVAAVVYTLEMKCWLLESRKGLYSAHDVCKKVGCLYVGFFFLLKWATVSSLLNLRICLW